MEIPQFVYWWCFCVVLGAVIGSHRGCPRSGFLLGLILGPIGCVLVFCLDYRPVCPECGGTTVRHARRCKHCGQSLPSPSSPPRSYSELVQSEMDVSESAASGTAVCDKCGGRCVEVRMPELTGTVLQCQRCSSCFGG